MQALKITENTKSKVSKKLSMAADYTDNAYLCKMNRI